MPPVAKRAAGADVTSESLLALRVSEVLELREGALGVLIEHGFTPLAQTHLRALLAPTLTLAQAIRLKSLSVAGRESLIGALLALPAADESGAHTAADDRKTPAGGAPCP